MMEESTISSTSSPPTNCHPAGLGRRVLRLWHKITIEPAVFLFTFAYGFHNIIAQNLLIEKVCHVNLNLSSEVCAHLEHHKEDQIAIQRTVALISLYTNIASSIPSLFLPLFLGPWSDRHGRKPLLIFPILGAILSQVVLIVFRAVPKAQAEFYIATAIYSFVSGGFGTFTTAMYSYISDVSRIRGRTTRIALTDFCLMFGFPVGLYTSSKVFLLLGYYGVFGITIGINILNVVFIFSMVKETCGPSSSYQLLDNEEVETDTQDTNTSEANWGLFDIRNVRSVFKVCFRRREHRRRQVLLLLLFIMIVNTTVFNTGTITYLYTRLKFDWNEQSYSLWTSISATMTSCATVIALPVLSFGLGISDGIIGMFGAVSGIANNILIAFITKDWMMYVCSAIGAFSTSSAIVMRAMLSKVGAKEDLGKIFALVSCLESTVPIFAMPLMTYVYNATIDTLPGTVFLVQAGIFLIVFLVIMYVHCLLLNPNMRYGQVITNTSESFSASEEPPRTES